MRWMTTALMMILCHAAVGAEKPAWPFFAFDNGVGRGAKTPAEQAALLKELGYDGIGYTGCADIANRLSAFEAAGLRVFNLYVNAKVDPAGPSFDKALPDTIRQLKGKDVTLWLYVTGKAPDADQQAVKMIRELSDLAEASNIKIALYPHTGFHVATVADALRIVKLVDRKNVGVTFNLCHFLKLDKAENVEKTLKEAAPHLFLVSINGADLDGKDWNTLIRPLDEGSFDNAKLLKMLRDIGYKGPIGLQCYNIKLDSREHLTRSIAAWKKLNTALDGK